MNSEKLNLISKDISIATSDWIIDHPTGSKFYSLESAFMPLLKGLIENCDWVVTGVKTGDSKFFIPKVSTENEFIALISKLIQSLSNIGESFSTIDLCLDLQYYSKALKIVSTKDKVVPNCSDFWFVEVEDLVMNITKDLHSYTSIIEVFNNEVKSNEIFAFSPRRLKTLAEDLKNKLKVLASPNIKSTDFPLSNVRHIKDEKFCLYILLVTLINNNWTEVIMLPSISPAGHMHHPGGIVICVTSNSTISNNILVEIRKIASIPFMPWMLTARTTEREGSKNLMPKIAEFRKAIINDYRQIEYLMGGKKYTLTNKSLFKLKKGQIEHKIPSIVGLTQLFSLMKDIEPDSVQHDNNGKLLSIEQSIVKQLIENLQQSFVEKKKQEDYSIWNKELGQKKANLKTSIAEGVQNSISIIVPIASSDERFENFKSALKSYDSQSAIIKYPQLFELIILVDSNDKDNNYRKNKAYEIKEFILNNLLNLKLILSIAVYYSTAEKSVGRSSIRNFGIAKSLGSVIQLFDDSIVLQKNYLEEILIRFEHLKGQKLAIVGFKERLDASASALNLIGDLMNKHEFLIPDAREDFKRKEKLDKEICYLFKSISSGDEVDYMELTGDLCFMNGTQKIGYRELNQFFSTSNVAFWKNDIKDSGGFHYRFDDGWGMEDGFMGLLMVANGTKIVPCYSALAFDLKHEKDISKKSYKELGEEIENLEVFKELNQKTISNYSRKFFNEEIKKINAFEIVKVK